MKKTLTEKETGNLLRVFMATAAASVWLTACFGSGKQASSSGPDSAPAPATAEKENSSAESTVSPEEKKALEKEKAELQTQIKEKTEKLETLQERCMALEQAKTEGWESQIRQSYARREEAALEAEALIMSAMTGINMVTLDTIGFEDIFIDGMVDEVMGNEILSSSAKSAIEAAAADKSLDSILEGARTGAIEGIQGYAKGKAKEYLSDKIGADIFSAVGLVDELVHAEDTPAALANGIAAGQGTKADELLRVLQTTSMTAGDIRNAAENLYQLKSLEEEASAITGNPVEGNKDEFFQQLEFLSRQYGTENYQILRYAEWEKAESRNKEQEQKQEPPKEEPSLPPGADLQEEISEYRTYAEHLSEQISEWEEKAKKFDTSEQKSNREKLRTLLDADRTLYELSPGRLEWNYDVEMFQEIQKSANQAGTLGKALFGGLMGPAMAATQQDNMNQVYENRIQFYDRLAHCMEESIRELNRAKAEFDSCYEFWESLADLESEEDLIKYTVGLERGSQGNCWEQEKTALIQALAQYDYDLKNYILFYDLTLSSRETPFVSRMQQKRDAVHQALEQYDPEDVAGYTRDEKNQRYIELLEDYRDTVDFMARMSEYDDGITYQGDRTAYNVGFFRAYGNKGEITYIQECTSSTFVFDQVEKRYYDRSGKVLYLSLSQGTVTLDDDEIIDYTCPEEYIANLLIDEAMSIQSQYPDQKLFERQYQYYEVN